jgi:hypothetical protein
MRALLLFTLFSLTAFGAPLEPYRHNFFTTNPSPVVEVVAGTNTSVQYSTAGTDTRRYTVNSLGITNGQAGVVLDGLQLYSSSGNAVITNNSGVMQFDSGTGTKATYADGDWLVTELFATNGITSYGDITLSGTISGDGSGLTNLSASAISGVLTQGHSSAVTLSNALTVVGTNYVTKLAVGNSDPGGYAGKVTGTMYVTATLTSAGTVNGGDGASSMGGAGFITGANKGLTVVDKGSFKNWGSGDGQFGIFTAGSLMNFGVTSNGNATVAGSLTATNGVVAMSGGTNTMTFDGNGLTVSNNTPVANQVLFNIATSDDASRFSVDEDGDVLADASFSAPALTGSTLVTSPLFRNGSSAFTIGRDVCPLITVLATNVNVSGSLIASNGAAMYQLATIPTNSVPVSSSGITNFLFINLTNIGPCYVFTNYTDGGLKILRPTLTEATWP